MKRKIITAISVTTLAVLLATGCSYLPSSQNQAPQPSSTPMPTAVLAPVSKTETKGTPKGEVITEDTVSNEEGNYFFPVPDSWLNKTSYELDGTSTYVYHITQNSDQPELNPVLISIGVAVEGEEAQGDVFLELDGLQYYTIPRFDFPYAEGSNDASEFQALYEEVPTVTQNIWLIDESAWQNRIKTGPFTVDDTYVGSFHIGDAQDDVLAKAGQPDKSYDVEVGATGEIRNINEYPFGSLVFVEDKLVTVQVTDNTYTGPRGIEVGMMIDEVAEKFVPEKETETDALAVYYRSNPGDDINFAVPPSAVLYKGDMQTLAYSEFSKESGARDMTIEELKGDYNYIYMEQYELVCQFDAQGVMLSFSVRLGVPSE